MKFSFNDGDLPKNQYNIINDAISTIQHMILDSFGGRIYHGVVYPYLIMNQEPEEIKYAIDTLTQFYRDCFNIIHTYYVIELTSDDEFFKFALGKRINHDDRRDFDPNKAKTLYTRTLEATVYYRGPYSREPILSSVVHDRATVNPYVIFEINHNKHKKTRFLTQFEYDTLMHYFKIHNFKKIEEFLNL